MVPTTETAGFVIHFDVSALKLVVKDYSRPLMLFMGGQSWWIFSEFKFSEKELRLGYAGNICFSNPQKQRLLKLRNPGLSDFLNYLTQRVINLSQAHIYGWVIQHWPPFPLKNAFNYLKRTKSSDFAKAVGKRSFVCWSAFQASVFRLRWKLCLLDTFHSTFNHFLHTTENGPFADAEVTNALKNV